MHYANCKLQAATLGNTESKWCGLACLVRNNVPLPLWCSYIYTRHVASAKSNFSP